MRGLTFNQIGNGVALSALMSLLAACSPLSVQQVRERPPSRIEVVQGNYATLGACVVESMQTGPRDWSGGEGGLHYDVANRSDLRRYSFTGKSILESMSFPIVDVIFFYESDDRTKVEIRNAGSTSMAISNLAKYVDIVSSYVEKCSSKAPKGTMPSPPIAAIPTASAALPAQASSQSKNKSESMPMMKSADRLRELNDLRSQGLISEDEYIKKRSEIISSF